LSGSPSRYTKKDGILPLARSTYCKPKSTLSFLEEKPRGLAPERRAETSTEKEGKSEKTRDKRREKDRKKKMPPVMDNTFNPKYAISPS
jgi:hypothetical protein